MGTLELWECLTYGNEVRLQKTEQTLYWFSMYICM